MNGLMCFNFMLVSGEIFYLGYNVWGGDFGIVSSNVL